jgi:hypothetical protein
MGQLLTLDEESVGGSMEPPGNAAYAEGGYTPVMLERDNAALYYC